MKIGIFGTGSVGRALGVLLAAGGYELCFGASDLAAASEAAAKAGRGASAGGVDDAARFGDVLLCTLRSALPLAPEASRGNVVIDIRARSRRAEAKAPRPASGTRLARAFYDLPPEAFDMAGAVPLCEYGAALLLCGDDPGAKAVAASLADLVGFAPVDCGPLGHARVVGALGDAIRLLTGYASQGRASRVTPARWPAAP